MGASSGVARAPQLCSGIGNHIREFLLVQRYFHMRTPAALLLLLDLLVGRLARLLFSRNHSQPAGGCRRGSGTAVIVFIDPAM